MSDTRVGIGAAVTGGRVTARRSAASGTAATQAQHITPTREASNCVPLVARTGAGHGTGHGAAPGVAGGVGGAGGTGAGRGVGPCDLVTVPARQGLEAVDILRLRDGVGPVLHDGAGDTLGFLVPPGTAEGWDLPGSACTQALGRPRAAVEEPPVAGTGWLVPPEGAYCPATEPSRLRAALGEAARTIEAADRCR